MTTNQRDILAALLTIIHVSGHDIDELAEKAIAEYSAVRLLVEDLDIRMNYKQEIDKFKEDMEKVLKKCGI
jgi:hypothetical protein